MTTPLTDSAATELLRQLLLERTGLSDSLIRLGREDATRAVTPGMVLMLMTLAPLTKPSTPAGLGTEVGPLVFATYEVRAYGSSAVAALSKVTGSLLARSKPRLDTLNAGLGVTSVSPLELLTRVVASTYEPRARCRIVTNYVQSWSVEREGAGERVIVDVLGYAGGDVIVAPEAVIQPPEEPEIPEDPEDPENP